MRRTLVRAACCVLVGLALGACAAISESLPPSRGGPTADRESEWRVIAPGLERRDMQFQSDAGFQTAAILVRIDPSQTVFQVQYRPGAPLRLDEWRDALPQAAIIVNGGFFDETGRALGLLVSNGQPFGQSYAGFGGMLQGVGNSVRLRSLGAEPYQGEPLAFAVQSYPMLIETGGVRVVPRHAGFDQRARRTVVGQDRAGRLVLVVFPYHLVSLAEVQEWLLASDLDLDIALALDGGRSTGLMVRSPSGDEFYASLDRLPSVIVVYSTVS